MSLFSPRRPDDVARMIGREKLGLIVTCDAAGYVATSLPLLAECDERGEVTALVGHCARANPHVERIRRRPEALISFLGPHGAIPSASVSKPLWAPTWNFAAAQLEVAIAFEPANTDAAVRALVAAVEGAEEGVRTIERMGQRYDLLLAQVIAFRAVVTSVTARFKLGQDEDRATFDEIVSYLSDTPLAAAMREQVEDADGAANG
jgi:transcriptional regulator